MARAVLLTRAGPVAQVEPTHGLCQGDDLHADPIAHGPVGLLWVGAVRLHHLQLCTFCEERILLPRRLLGAQPASDTPGFKVATPVADPQASILIRSNSVSSGVTPPPHPSQGPCSLRASTITGTFSLHLPLSPNLVISREMPLIGNSKGKCFKLTQKG